MKSGFTLQECLSLIEEDTNRDVLSAIRERLDEGEDITAVFPQYCSSLYRKHLTGFLRILSFPESLQLSTAIISTRGSLRRETLRELFYPSVLMSGTYLGIVLFNELCFPPLIRMMESFRLSPARWLAVQTLLRTVSILSGLLLIACTAVLLYFTRRKNIVRGYAVLLRFLPSSLPVLYVSVDFVRCFRQCVRLSLPTKQSLEILQELPERPLLKSLSSQIAQSLHEGTGFLQAMECPGLDRTLLRFLRIAVMSSEMDEMLDAYIDYSEERIRQRCRRVSRIIQVSSYALIGMIIILVYQVLMLPLTLMMQI